VFCIFVIARLRLRRRFALLNHGTGDIATDPAKGKGLSLANSDAARIYGLILAGGAGSRMGGADKSALVVGGVSFLARARHALGPAVRIAVAGGARVGPDAADGLPLLPDAAANAGPLAGLAAGLAWAEAGAADWLIVAPVDAPFLAASAYERLLDAARAEPELEAVVAEADSHVQWLTGAWRPWLAAEARRALDRPDRSVAAFLKTRRWRALPLATRPNMFLNVNAPADLAAANDHAAADSEGA